MCRSEGDVERSLEVVELEDHDQASTKGKRRIVILLRLAYLGALRKREKMDAIRPSRSTMALRIVSSSSLLTAQGQRRDGKAGNERTLFQVQ